MRAFRTSYKDKNGKTKQVKKWYVELRDHLNTIRRFPAFTDKEQSEALGRQIEKLIRYKQARQLPDPETLRWIEDMPRKLKARLIDIGVLERKKSGELLSVYLSEWQRVLSPDDKPSEHAIQVTQRAGRVFTDCGFISWQDVNREVIENYLKGLKKTRVGKGNPASEQTKAAFAKAIRQFGAWMVDTGRADVNPVHKLKSVKVPRHEERAFEVDEFRRLIEATEAGPVRLKLTGHERSLVYRFAVMTGLRRSELGAITPTSFDFNKRTVFLIGEHTKNGADALLPLTEPMCQEIKQYIRGKMPAVNVFRVTPHAAKMIQADCREAGIPVETERGKIKFHTLRHTCGSFLSAKGVHPKTIQEIMRHGDIRITMNRYTHSTFSQLTAAVNKLPDLSASSSESKRATGTDGKNLAQNLALAGGQPRYSVGLSGSDNNNSKPQTAITSHQGGSKNHNTGPTD